MWVAASYRGEARGLWINATKFGRNFRLVETMAVWPASCFGWKHLLLIPSHGTSGLPTPWCYVNKAPQSLAHCHASVVWWAAMGNNTPCRVPGANPGPSAYGKPVTWPLGHGSCIEEVPYCFSKSSINFKGHMGKKSPILPQILVFLDCNSVWIHDGFEMMHKAWCGIEKVPYCFSRSSIKFQGHTVRKIDDLNPILEILLGRS